MLSHRVWPKCGRASSDPVTEKLCTVDLDCPPPRHSRRGTHNVIMQLYGNQLEPTLVSTRFICIYSVTSVQLKGRFSSFFFLLQKRIMHDVLPMISNVVIHCVFFKKFFLTMLRLYRCVMRTETVLIRIALAYIGLRAIRNGLNV